MYRASIIYSVKHQNNIFSSISEKIEKYSNIVIPLQCMSQSEIPKFPTPFKSKCETKTANHKENS